MAENARTAKIPVIGIVILDRIENHRQAGKFAADGHRGLDAIHLAGQLDIHQDHIGVPLQAKRQCVFAPITIIDDLRPTSRLEATFERRAQMMIIFDNK